MIEDTELYEAFQTLMVNPDSMEDFAEKKVKESEEYRDLKPTQLKNLQSKIEMEADDRLDDYDDGFKPEFLHTFLVNDNDFFGNDKKTLSSKYQLKGKQLGELTNILVEDINNKYKGFSEIPKSTRDIMVKTLLKLSEVKGGVKSTDLDTDEIDDSKTIQRDKALLNKTLKNFLDENGKMLTYENTIEGDRRLTRVSLRNRNVNMREINKWKYVIQNQTPAIQRRLQPLLSVLRPLDEVEEQIIHLDADLIIGELDLKRLDRRNRIYNFWKGHKGKYNDFKEAYNACNEAFLPIRDMLNTEENKDDKDKQEIAEVIDKFLSFKSIINNGELDYVVKINPKELEPYFKRHKGLALYEKFIADVGLDNLKDTSDDRSARREGYYDKDSGDYKETITVEDGGETFDSDDAVTQERNVRAAENKKEMEELSRFGLKLERLTQKVDPLFYHAFTKDSGAFKDTVAFRNDINTLREAMLSAGAAREMSTGVDMDDEINEYVDAVEKTMARGGNGPYYLPLTKTVNRFMVTESWNTDDKAMNTERGINNRLRNIGEFLDNLSKILDAGDDLDRASAPAKATVGSSSDGVPPQSRPQLGTVNRKDHLADIEEAREEFDDLIQEVLDYFVVAISGSNKPFDDEFPFDTKTSKTQRIFRALATGRTDTALFKVLALEGRSGYMMVKPTELEDLTRMLEFLSSVDDKKDIGRLVNELTKGIKAVNFVLMNKRNSILSQETNIEFGSYLHKVLEANNIDWPEGEKFPNARGKTPAEWNEMYDESKVYPFEAIESHIKRNVGGYSGSKRTMVRGSDRKSKGSNTIVQRFIIAVDDMKILRSDLDSKLLDAHDNIRKMLGKPVYYNTGKVDNYEHIHSAMLIMKSKYNVDITAYEIENIVTETNSMDELSKKHGVPKEGVYFLKANFR
tara:strand:- start:840 stop:3581 length:2742 start_codon:yes stop_codon:yes gene_type:complete